MEKEDDVQLIHKIISGDDAAFSLLVEKYQKSVHTLVWQKIGDYHYAEDIMQNAFLQAYKKLSTRQGTHNLKVGACASSQLRCSLRVHRLTVAPL